MRTLYLDTSSSYLFVGIKENEQLLGQIKEKLDKELSSFTLPKIDNLFQELKLEPTDIDKIIVVNGPGSFTGVRIGVTIAKIYAWVRQKEITVISSLEAMATLPSKKYQYIVPMIDARRGYVYGGIYQQDGSIILKNNYYKQETLEIALEQLPGTSVIVTNDKLETKFEKIPYDPDILEIITRFENKESINPHSVEPEYLKRTEAEEKKDESNTKEVG